MEISLKVELKGQEELRAKLSDPTIVAGPLKDLLVEASDIAVETGKAKLESGFGTSTWGVRGVGAAPLSMVSSIKRFEARVKSLMPPPRALSIETGRPAGEQASIKQLARWVEAKGIGKLSARGEPLMGTVYAIVWHIKQRGVKGRFFMQAARDKVQGELPRLLNEMGTKIKEKFNR